MKIRGASVLVLWALEVGAAGDPATPILLKLKSYPNVGQTSVTKESSRSELSMRISGNDGKTISARRDSDSAEAAFSETTLRQTPAGRESRRRYERVVQTNRAGSRLLPRSGKTLLISESNGKFSIRNESGLPLETEEIQALSKELELSRKVAERNFCVPTSPVAIGQTWSIAPGEASICFNTLGELEPAGSRAEGKLLRTYEKNGRPFGTIEIDLALRVKNMGPLRFDAPAVFTARVKIDGCIDGASPEGSLSIAGSLEGSSHPQGNPSQPVLHIKLDLTGESTTNVGPN
ncbi:MAG TPA: hypothetical protein VF376_04595 [Thermoanaerobaculia bacterium]